MTKKKEKIISREISWLSFNDRVLQEAADKRNPLIERLKFLGIFSNNLDEFFRVRVATLNRIQEVTDKYYEPLSLSPKKILKKINLIVAVQQEKFNVIYKEILKALAGHNIFLIDEKQLNSVHGEFVRKYFKEEVRPNLFPIMLDGLGDTASLRDVCPWLAVQLYRTDGKVPANHALIEIPAVLNRFLILPPIGQKKYIILLDDVIRYCLSEVFRIFDYNRFDAWTIKFTRDAELDIDYDVSKSFMEQMAESLKQRKLGVPIRFIYDQDIPNYYLEKLRKKLHLSRADTIIPGGRYHNFKDFMNFPNIGTPALENPKIHALPHPSLDGAKSIIEAIRNKDIMLHFPYQSFKYIIDLLREASIDPAVKSIHITVYRLARNSNVIGALINAARNGKAVTVVMELQARFDETANIEWSEKLQDEGVRIIQSRTGFKVHAKLLLIKRREAGKSILYAHIGTGNFNEDTAGVYADDSLLTARPEIAAEVESVFQLFEQSYKTLKLKHLILSPYDMREHFIRLIAKEIKNAKKGKDAWITIKLNNLVDDVIAFRLYEAGKAGVKINMIIRGTCVLVPGVEGLSENIEAVSIVDKYLEHSRVFAFCNGGKEKYYISSADWMVRNFDHRIEVACPVYDRTIREELRNMLEIQLLDNVKSRIIDAEGTNQYRAMRPRDKVRSQIMIYDYLKDKKV